MTDLDRLTRELGAATQATPAYAQYIAAKEQNEADDGLNAQMREIEMIRLSYQHEAAKGDAADEAKMDEFDRQFNALYQQVMANPNMQRYREAATALDTLMKRTMGILSGCAAGEDPATFEPAAHSCGGDCGGCGGCQ
ncbi:MAG: YlbF family regulator [Oscillospiraceae bacterium]|jgi:cell fate (sporulation/competence/biofilm development) regulator YlbF (YheA/YmcA/DUF963 family)|nr:YlbF family regulator [Oscillospiraceae bacterium]